MNTNSRIRAWAAGSRFTTRASASLLLLAAFAMVFETACSESPPPEPAPQPTTSPSEIRSRAALYAADHAVIRVHTRDGTIIPSSQYSLNDSVLVITDVLRGKDYVPELTEPQLVGQHGARALPEDVTLPLQLPLDQIVAVQRWNYPPRPNVTGPEVGPRLAVYASEEVVARIHTVDGTIIPTSHYEVNDSVVVISNVLRDDKYFAEADQPRLYGKSCQVKALPENVSLPLTIPVSDLATVDQWQDPHKTSKGIKSGVWIAAAVGVVVAFVVSFEGFGAGDLEWR